MIMIMAANAVIIIGSVATDLKGSAPNLDVAQLQLGTWETIKWQPMYRTAQTQKRKYPKSIFVMQVASH